MKKLLLITATLFFLKTGNAQTTFDYFGQTPPGNTAIKFAPGIISLPDRFEVSIAFSFDGNECYINFTDVGGNDPSKIYYTKYVNNIWTKQEEASFSIGHNVSRPFLSKDGNKLFFGKSNDIWFVERKSEGWGEPQILPSPINTDFYESDYTETTNGVAYITSDQDEGNYGIWRIQRLSDETLQVKNLGPILDPTYQEYHSCIAPDGSYLIFGSNRPGAYSYQDLYVSFNFGNDEWTAPVNLNKSGAKINITYQICPSLSPDGKYLFFGRHNHEGTTSDIYWVSTDILDTLKKIAMPTTLVNQAIDKKVMLYPNPTSGPITLSLGTSQSHESLVEIYNLQGTQVFSKTYKNTPSATIDLTGNSAGIYVVKVIAGGVSYEEKIVKE